MPKTTFNLRLPDHSENARKAVGHRILRYAADNKFTCDIAPVTIEGALAWACTADDLLHIYKLQTRFVGDIYNKDRFKVSLTSQQLSSDIWLAAANEFVAEMKDDCVQGQEPHAHIGFLWLSETVAFVEAAARNFMPLPTDERQFTPNKPFTPRHSDLAAASVAGGMFSGQSSKLTYIIPCRDGSSEEEQAAYMRKMVRLAKARGFSCDVRPEEPDGRKAVAFEVDHYRDLLALRLHFQGDMYNPINHRFYMTPEHQMSAQWCIGAAAFVQPLQNTAASLSKPAPHIVFAMLSDFMAFREAAEQNFASTVTVGSDEKGARPAVKTEPARFELMDFNAGSALAALVPGGKPN